MASGPSSEQRERIAAYLRGQAEKYTWLELWPRVMGGRLELLDAIRDVSVAQATFRSAADDWTIREIVAHALRASRGVAGMVEQLAHGKAPPDASPDPPRETTDRSIIDLRRDLLADSVAFAGLTTRLPEPPAFVPTAGHMFFGPLPARAWYLFQRVHDQDHAQQVLGVKQAPGYPSA